MQLNKFIEKLRKIEEEHGGGLPVIMADDISVVTPVFSDKYYGKKVVITDQK